jgi:excisionase family DNA binding protein
MTAATGGTMQTSTEPRDPTPELPSSFVPDVVVAGPYLTADEAASVLRTTRRAVYAMIQRGQLGTCVRRVDRRVLIERAGLVAQIESVRLAVPEKTATSTSKPVRATKATSTKPKAKAPSAPAPVFLPRAEGGG